MPAAENYRLVDRVKHLKLLKVILSILGVLILYFFIALIVCYVGLHKATKLWRAEQNGIIEPASAVESARYKVSDYYVLLTSHSSGLVLLLLITAIFTDTISRFKRYRVMEGEGYREKIILETNKLEEAEAALKDEVELQTLSDSRTAP